MAATTQVTDFSDLYTDLMNRTRVDTSLTATSNQAKRYINIALHDMHIGFGEKLPWAERTAILRTKANYTTGTLVATKGSTTITGTGTAWNTNDDFGEANMIAGGKIVIDGSPEVYEISAVASDTSATLSSAWIDATTTASTYEYFEDEYALASDFLRPYDVQSFDVNDDIDLIGRREFRQRYPRNKNTGKPSVAAIFDKTFGANTTRVRKVRFWKPPDNTYLFPYSYITSNLAVDSSGSEQTQLSADTDEPIVPLIYRHAIVLHALYHWYRDKKSDERSQQAKAEYTDLMLRIVADTEVGAPVPQFRPRLGPYREAARRPYRGGGRKHIVGDRFDRML